MAMAPLVLSRNCSSPAGHPVPGARIPGTYGTHGHGTYDAIMHQRAVPRGCPILGTWFPEGNAIPMVPSH